MSNPPSSKEFAVLEKLFSQYESLLKQIEIFSKQSRQSHAEPISAKMDPMQADLLKQLVIDLFVKRDSIEAMLESSPDEAVLNDKARLYVALVRLDERLREQTDIIVKNVDLLSCRQSIKPKSTAWWWSLELPPPKNKPHKSDRFDWVWNGFTVVFLVSAISFAANTAKAFSVEGFDVLGLASSFMQGAGLAFVAGGTFTEKGKQKTEKILESISVPHHYHAEVTCGVALALLSFAYLVNSNLYRLGEYYYDQGKTERHRGDNISALRSFQKALAFSPDKKEVYSALGRASERMGQLDKAIDYYEQGLALSDPSSALGLGRVTLIKALSESGWTTAIDELQIRQVEFYLELASQFNTGFDESGQPREVVDVVIEQQTHFGLLELAKINLNQLHNSQDTGSKEQVAQHLKVQESLRKAVEHFLKAHWEEMQLLAMYGTTDATETTEKYQKLRAAVSHHLEMSSEIGALELNREDILEVLEKLTHMEKMRTLDRFIEDLDHFIEDLPTQELSQLKTSITFDLGKPRCYAAIARLIHISVSASNLSNQESNYSPLETLNERQDIAEYACGAESSNAPTRTSWHAHKIDLFTLSLYDKALMSKLLELSHSWDFKN